MYECFGNNQSVLATASEPLSSASVLLASLSVSASEVAVVVVMASFEDVVTVDEVVVVADEACEAKEAELLLLFLLTTKFVPKPYRWPQYFESSMSSSKNISFILKKV